MAFPTELGAGGSSVLSLWQAKAPGQPLLAYPFADLDEFSQCLARLTVLVLDNASIHRAAGVQARQAEWAARDLRLQFLPAHCPELNKIELHWYRCKYHWLMPADYESEQSLLERLTQLLPMDTVTFT